MAANRGARLGRGDKAFPRRIGGLGLGSHDLDLVTIGELGPQRHDAAIDLGADATVPEIGMDGIGEIDGGRILGQLVERALGGKNEDLVLEHRQPGVFQQFFGGLAASWRTSSRSSSHG